MGRSSIRARRAGQERMRARRRRGSCCAVPGRGRPSTWLLSRRLFVSGVALVYGLAFAELLVQVQGLFGSRGIAPVAALVDRAAAALHAFDRLQDPSLLWFSATDGTLTARGVAGTALAGWVLVGILPRLLLCLCWLGYLSFATFGEPFLFFQWDALLLEAGVLAVALAPNGWRPYGRNESEPPRPL